MLCGPQGNIFQIIQAFDIPPAPDHVLHPGELDDPAFYIQVAAAHRFHHFGYGDVIGRKTIGIQGDLILFDEPAHAGHLGNPGHAFDGQFQIPILEGPQLGQVQFPGLIHNGIREPPAQTGGVRTQYRVDIGRELVLYGLEIFQNSASGPINVGAFLKDDIDKGTAQIRETPDGLHLGGGQKGGGNGIGDLIFHQVRAPARPFGKDNHLGIA